MEKNSNSEQKKKVIFMGLTMTVLMVIIGVSYAFFSSPVEQEEEKLIFKAGDLSLTFRDNDETVENTEGTWNFGDTIEKELVIENTGTRDGYAKISWDNLINTYLAESLTYTLEEKSDDTNAVWKMIKIANANVPRSETATTQLLADHLFVPAGHIYTYRVRITFEYLEDIDQTADLNAIFITKFLLEVGTEKTLVEKLADLKLKISENNPTNFATPAMTDETENGLFSMEDDYGTSYYYRGTAPNNYIKFGQNASGQDMWWRIIRFNGDGTIRMQYDGVGSVGTNTYTRGFALTNQVWNGKYNDAKYVGWMFGGANGSASRSKEEAQRNETDEPIKKNVDQWYETNIVNTGYSDYVADSIFCNDRSTPGRSATGLSGDTGLGYGGQITSYGATARVGGPWQKTVIQPQFICPQENDKFTVEESSGGNGALTYPVGLITADEIVAAGSGKYNTVNNHYYLYKGTQYWTFSADHMDGRYAYVYSVKGGGFLFDENILSSAAIAPVINLKAEYLDKLKGNGTFNYPYHLEI